MQTTIVKWGNSQGIRLPKLLLDSANLAENDMVEVTTENGSITIKKLENKRTHMMLKERLAGYEGVYVSEEWDTGAPVGKEVL